MPIMEKSSRLRSRKRSSSAATARKIASCKITSCKKRFITFSGSDMCVDCRGKGVTNDEVRVQEEPVVQANDSDTVQNTCGARQTYAANSIAPSTQGANVENGYESSSTAESADAGSVIGINDDGSGTNNVETQQNLQREATSKEQIDAGEEGTTGDLPVSEVALDANASEGKLDQGEHAFDNDDEQVVADELSLSNRDRSSQHASSSLFFACSGRVSGKPSYRCFICNADLSTVQGLKGRMNHIKRCGKKHGIQAGDGAKGLHVDQMGGTDIEKIGQCTEVNNTDTCRQGWHDDKDAALAIDDASSHAEDITYGASTAAQPKQSSLNTFFTRPVRSLDKVLLQGARNVAKKEQIASKRQQESTKAGRSNGRGRGGGSWKRQKREPPTSCPAYKRISNTTVLVDAFHYANPALPQTHFLTHFHSDHYGGITKHWNTGIIYCSLPTASLVHSQLGVAKKYLHPLPMHTKTVIDANGRPISVTLLDANHCPGAVMFLFEPPNGKQILHVGDFRWSREVMLDQPQLKQFWQGSKGMRLDDIYLDTTYCNDKYSTMPSQKEAITAAVSMAREEMEGPATSSFLPKCMARKKTSTLLLFGSYTIGKEKIYMSAAEALNMRIYVEPRKLRILSALNFTKDQMSVFTTTKSEAQIWIVPMGHCSFQHLDAYLTDANASSKGLGSGYSRVVAFRPTGWTHNGGPPKSRGASNNTNALITTRRSGNKTIHGVPYSEHSSFSELVDCLLCLKPKRIIPTVSVSSSEAQIERLLRAAHEEETRES